MRVLIVSKAQFPIPPEAVPMLIDGMTAWMNKYTKEKKMEQVFGFAGLNGGGGILNVNSAEELDAIMTEFPFGPWSQNEVYILSDVNASLANFKRVMAQMAPPPGQTGPRR